MIDLSAVPTPIEIPLYLTQQNADSVKIAEDECFYMQDRSLSSFEPSEPALARTDIEIKLIDKTCRITLTCHCYGLNPTDCRTRVPQRALIYWHGLRSKLRPVDIHDTREHSDVRHLGK